MIMMVIVIIAPQVIHEIERRRSPIVIIAHQVPRGWFDQDTQGWFDPINVPRGALIPWQTFILIYVQLNNITPPRGTYPHKLTPGYIIGTHRHGLAPGNLLGT